MKAMGPKTRTNKLSGIMTDAAAKTRNVRCSMMLEPEVHQRLKMHSAKTGTSMSKLINEWVRKELDQLDRMEQKD